MAEKKNPEEVRREALIALEQGRAGLSAEVRSLRHDLNPANAAHSLVQKHPTALIGVAAGVGLLLAWLCTRRKSSVLSRDVKRFTAAAERAAHAARAARAASSATPLSFVGDLVGLSAKTAIPLLGKLLLERLRRRTNEAPAWDSPKP